MKWVVVDSQTTYISSTSLSYGTIYRVANHNDYDSKLNRRDLNGVNADVNEGRT